MKLDDVKIGMEVYLRVDAADGPDEYSPGGVYGRRGDKVIVKSVLSGLTYSIAVHHPDVTDGSAFRVAPDEVMIESPLVTVQERKEYEKRYGRPAP